MIQGFQHQIAEVVPRQFAIAAEAVFEHRGSHARFGDQLIQAVTGIAPGNAPFRTANTAGRTAVIGGGDNTG
ncbi:hypothetical protein D3C71_1868860 [compost metagenome]